MVEGRSLMQFGVLGSLEVRDDEGRAIDLSSRRQRRLLAALLIHAGSVVSDDRLAEMVWDDDEFPDNGVRSLRTVMSRLRTTLDQNNGRPQHVLTKPPGYLFELNDSVLDATRFEQQVASGTRLLRGGDATKAAEALDEASRLWRGAAYAEFADQEWARIESARLEELRAVAAEARIDALLLRGQHAELIGDIEQMVAAHPFRETPRVQLITALYRSRRQADALHAYQDYREFLADELGLDPSESLRQLEGKILRHDPELDAPAPSGPQIKTYRLLDRLGGSEWGEVWRARQPSVDRDVAVKVIDRRLADNSEFIRRFEADSRIIAALEHPHITPLFDYWRDPTGAYLVMRLMRGGSAAHRLHTSGSFSLAEVAAMVEQVGSALAAAHRAGVAHRAVTPSNVLLDADGTYFLTDFGATPYAFDGAGSVGHPDVAGLASTAGILLAGEGEHLTDIPTEVADLIRRATSIQGDREFNEVAPFVDAFLTAVALRDHPDGASSSTPTAAITERQIVNPYKGLRPFEVGDANDFFGRDDLVDQLIDLIDRQRFVAAVGPSGAGKSSLVRAGLLPALRAGRLPRSESWFVITMVPGANPFEELESALLHVAVNPPTSLLEQLDGGPTGIARAVKRTLPSRDAELLIVVDQFEELFTQTDEETAGRFIEGLAAAVADRNTPLRVAITLRADFFDLPLNDHRLAKLLNEATVPVGAMAPEDLAAAITSPAVAVGLAIDPSLVSELVADAAGQASALPLLQFMLTELFDQRSGSTLTHGAYRSLGGLNGVIAQRAEHLYRGLDPDERRAARVLFGRLVALGDGVADTRRRTRRADLEAGHHGASTASVIDRFGQARLLAFDRDPVTREPTVEIAHEALLRAWPRLRDWLQEDREVLRSVAQIATAASAWEASGHDAGDLLRGARLSAAWEFDDEAGVRLTPSERDFVDVSHEVFEREQTLQRTQNRRLRSLLVGAVSLLVLSLVAGGLALHQRARASAEAAAATEAASDAETRRINTLPGQLVTSNRRIALLMAVEAFRRKPGPESLGALQEALVGSGELLGYYGGGTRYESVEWIDDHRLAAASAHGVDIFTEGETNPRTIGTAGFRRMAVSPAGDLLAFAHDSSIAVLDVETGERVGEDIAVEGLIQAMTFSPDGRSLAVGTDAGMLLIHDVATGVATSEISAHPEQTKEDLGLPDAVVTSTMHVPASAIRGVTAIKFLDDRFIASGGWGKVKTWDLATGQSLRDEPLTHLFGDETVVSVAAAIDTVAIDGVERLAITDRYQLLVLDTVTLAAIVPSGPLPALPSRDSFATLNDPDSPIDIRAGRLAADYGVGAFQVLDVAPGGSMQSVDTQFPDTTGVAISPDGTRAAASGSGGIVIASLDGGGLLAEAFEVPNKGDAWIDTDGSTIGVMSLERGKSGLWHLAGGTATPVEPIGIEPDFILFTGHPGSWLGVHRADGAMMIDPVTGEITVRFAGWDTSKGTLGTAVSPNGALLFLASGTGLIELRSTKDGSVVTRVEEFMATADRPAVPFIAAWTPDSRSLSVFTGSAVKTVDVATGKVHTLQTYGLGAIQIVYSPDGRHILTAHSDGSILERDALTFQPTGKRFVGNTSAGSGDLGPWYTTDGSMMISFADGQGRLWDVASAQQIGGAFPSDGGWTGSASTGGRWLITGRGDHLVRWNLNLASWPEIACRATGRNLTRDEWEQFGPGDQEYHATCPDYPEALATDEGDA
jgi:DNA-binding SARP family transcriptional activator/WD40 repeat protein